MQNINISVFLQISTLLMLLVMTSVSKEDFLFNLYGPLFMWMVYDLICNVIFNINKYTLNIIK